MVEKLDPNALINPSSGLFSRNPTHAGVAEYAEDQSDIVKAIKESGIQRKMVTYNYADYDPTDPPPLVGITKIREMKPESAQNFFKNLMRSKPNIFKMHIKLGEYPSVRRLNSGKIQALTTNKPRFQTELGVLMGDIMTDPSMRVTEIRYVVNNADPGTFNTSAEVYGTTEAEYKNNKLFKPIISFEFIKTT